MAAGKVQKTVRKDGLRIVTETLPAHRSVALGIWVDVGSRYEPDAIAGASHFLEHMVFKGTPTRNAREIALYLERLGGVLNAFTTREHTCYHARVLDQHLPEAVALLSDIATQATIPAHEVKKERGVICEEIKDVEDTPNEAVHDLFTACLWPGHPVGRPIMGSIQTVSAMTKGTLSAYRRKYYTADRVVVAASGGMTHEKLLKLIDKHLKLAPANGGIRTESPNGIRPIRQINGRDIKQTHVCLGMPTWPFADPRRHALLVANNILGGGMSSRLFQSVREKRGLVYTIFAFHDALRDTGHFAVYFACDPANTVQATDLVLREIGRLRTTPMPAKELADVKSQLKGNLVLGLESTQARMHRLARHELFLGRHIPPEDTMKSIDKVRAVDVQTMAQDVFTEDALALSIIGPATNDLLNHIHWENLSPRRSKRPES